MIITLGGIDYNSGPYTVIIPANVKEVSFSILITYDNEREKNESFLLVIDSSSLPDGVVIDAHSQAIITIVDATKCNILIRMYLIICVILYNSVVSCKEKVYRHSTNVFTRINGLVLKP